MKTIAEEIRHHGRNNHLPGPPHLYHHHIMRKGASIEMASGLPGHQSVATTKSYWIGLEDDAVKKVTGNLLDLD